MKKIFGIIIAVVFMMTAGAGATFAAPNYGQEGIPGVAMNVDLGLPASYDAVITGTSTYARYLEHMAELGDASESANVIEPIPIQGEIELYVAPEGSDTNSGSITAPFKTIQKALACVEEIQSSIDLDVKGIVVYLREGTYLTSETIVLDQRYSGKNDISVIISAYNGEKVSISGGVDIAGSNFSPVTDEVVLKRLQKGVRNDIVVADLGDLGITEYGTIEPGDTGGPTYQLYMNGARMTLARYPNTTALSLGKVLDIGPITQTYSDLGPAGTNSESTGIEYVMQDFRPLNWVNTGKIWIKGALYAEWDTQNMRVSEIRENTTSIKLDGGSTLGAISRITNTYFYYNVLEELDVPGEFFLDSETGLLYLYPMSDLTGANVTLAARQNDIIRMNGTRNIVLNGLDIGYGGGRGIVMNDQCYQTVVQNCTIQNIVSTGVVINGKRSGVIHSTIQYIGNYPVMMPSDNAFLDYTPDNNFVQNCYIHNVGQLNPKYSYIAINGVGNVISHNLIQGTYSVSIYNQRGRECIVEYNEIVGGPNGTFDSGSIYSVGFPITRGNHYRYNYIHDVYIATEGSNPHGIYLDEMTSENYVYGNVLENVPNGFLTNSGGQNVVINNVVLNGRTGSDRSIFGSSNFNNYTLPQWMARSSVVQYTYDLFNGSATINVMTDEEKTALKNRYPTLYQYLDDIHTVLAERAALGDAYVITEKEKALVTASENYFVGNIVYNHESITAAGTNHTITPNLETSEDPFADWENGDYRLKDGISAGFDYMPIPFANIGKMGAKEGIGSFTRYAPSNGSSGKVYSREVLLKWTAAAGADYYVVTVATNAALTEGIKEIKTEAPFYFMKDDEYFDYGETYYWSVTAYTTAASRIDTPIVSDQSISFTTMTEEEYLATTKANTMNLKAAILKAKALDASIIEGSDAGQYAVGTKAVLEAAIAAAEQVITEIDTKLQDEVDAATRLLNQAIMSAIAKQKMAHTTFEAINLEDWAETGDVKTPRAAITLTDNDELLMKVTGDRSEVVYKDIIGLRQMLYFDFYLESLTDWNGFALRQTITNAFVTNWRLLNSYFIVISPEQIELQKRVGEVDYGNIAVVENNNEIMSSGQWYNIQLGAVNEAEGVRILFKVNGETVFDYLDKENAIMDAGYFGIVVQQANGDTMLRTSDMSQYDFTGPVITSTTVAQTNSASIKLTGTVDEKCDIYVDGVKVITGNPAGDFNIKQKLVKGSNTFTVKAIDMAGNETSIAINIERKADK